MKNPFGPMGDWAKGMLINFAIGFLARLLSGAVTNDELTKYGETAGRWLTDNCRKPLGDKWEDMESVLQDKAGVLFVGLMAGLDYDDNGAE